MPLEGSFAARRQPPGRTAAVCGLGGWEQWTAGAQQQCAWEGATRHGTTEAGGGRRGDDEWPARHRGRREAAAGEFRSGIGGRVLRSEGTRLNSSH